MVYIISLLSVKVWMNANTWVCVWRRFGFRSRNGWGCIEASFSKKVRNRFSLETLLLHVTEGTTSLHDFLC